MKSKSIFIAIFFSVILSSRLHAQCSKSGSVTSLSIVSSTGNSDFDALLKRGSLFFTEVLDLDVKASIYDDSGSPNALAICNEDLIAMGRKLVTMKAKASRAYGFEEGFQKEIRVLSILAHEFAHHLQCKFNYSSPNPEHEIQADWIAGALVNLYLKLNYKITNEQDPKSRHVIDVDFAASMIGAMLFYEMGDYGFYSIDHHGTPGMRAVAFDAGGTWARDNYLTFFVKGDGDWNMDTSFPQALISKSASYFGDGYNKLKKKEYRRGN